MSGPFLTYPICLEGIQFFEAPRPLSDERRHQLCLRPTKERFEELLQRCALGGSGRDGGRIKIAKAILLVPQ